MCCGKELPPSFNWYVCDKCGYRICPFCLNKHRGPYSSSGGFRCSQCQFGVLRYVPGL